jgi:DNA replication protein DnaC
MNGGLIKRAKAERQRQRKQAAEYERKFQQIVRVRLLIVDDFALKPLRAPHDEDFHDLIAAWYERAASILTL